MNDLDSMAVILNLTARQTLFKLLRIEFDREPKDENGIKLCNEQLEILEKQVNDIIINGTGDRNKELAGKLKLIKFKKRE